MLVGKRRSDNFPRLLKSSFTHHMLVFFLLKSTHGFPLLGHGVGTFTIRLNINRDTVACDGNVGLTREDRIRLSG